MSIVNSYEIQMVEGDGETKRFRFNFFVFKREEVRLKIIEESGEIRDLEFENDYTVENKVDYSEGGWLELKEVVEVGCNLVMWRKTAITQEINLMYLTTLNPLTLTAMLDKVTAICQELFNEFYRSLKFQYEPLSLIDQEKVLNEYNLKNLDVKNKNKVVAVALRYNEDSGKWELTTTAGDPDAFWDELMENRRRMTLIDEILEILNEKVENVEIRALDYNESKNKPTINYIELKGDKQHQDFFLQGELSSSESIEVVNNKVIKKIGERIYVSGSNYLLLKKIDGGIF